MNVSFLRPLYERPGPWASVYLDGTRNNEDPAGTVELRWRAARESLEAALCDPGTLDALGRALLGHTGEDGRYGLAAFATAGEVAMLQVLPAPPRRDIAAFGPLPHVMPLLAQMGESIPYVRVLVDRTGGRIEAVDASRLVRTDTVAGTEQWPVHRVKPGGWSQPRYQRAAHVSWERNAGTVAAAVADAAERCGAEVILVAGDPQARPLLVAQLPEHWRERVVETSSTTGPAALEDVTVHAIAERAAEKARAVLDRYQSRRGNDAAGDGLPAVVTALQRGQVGTVLLVDDPTSTTELWIGPEPAQLSFDRAELIAMGVRDTRRVRADAALVRAIVGTEADLLFAVPDELPVEGGVAALLRYADAGTRRR
ncbi:Vms1/Ankzf1 family peptidyl-tRNA hydrolase [Dactylosporangium sp. NPDC049140]|uniref:baeRF2 domain-containing protein n=1 Tax=Dactylosporangium sp. NPDC049140 TaxID=3155647 RepID=UPI0033ECF779